tara:strand:- start:1409 stop:1732 length:324 start_codon:yes stop_codon:yes gene_type:complete
MKTYKTYQARNAVKAAQVTNHIIAAKKLGESHSDAKAEAYRLYNIKQAIPILKKHFSGGSVPTTSEKPISTGLPPLPAVNVPFPPLPPLPTPVSAAKVAIMSELNKR